MSNQIKTIATATAASWSTSVYIENASGDIVFHTVGGTFSDGNTQKSVSPINGLYTVSITGMPPQDQGTTQIVSMYYEFDGEWQLCQDASRILVLPQSREIDFRIQRSGFGVLPKDASLSSTYQGLAIIGEAKIPTGDNFRASFNAGNVLRLDKIPSGLFDTTKSPFIAHDRTNGVVYFLNAASTLAQLTVGATLTDVDDDQIVQVFERLNGTAREFTVFYRSGRVDVYDKGLNFLSHADTGIKQTQRVVYRRKNVGTNGTADTYVAFDALGVAYNLSASYAQTSVLSDQFYTDASDSYNVLCTRSGKLVGNGVSNAPQGFAFYQFVPASLIAVGVNVATGSICQFNIRDNSLYAPSRNLVQDNRVVYNATADWSPDGTGLTGGLDTVGSNDLFRFIDSTAPQNVNTGFSYLGVYGEPYTTDSSARRFYAVARPTNALSHLNVRDYTAVLPEFDQAGSTNVQFSMTVQTGDADIPLEIRFPDGVTWTATVDGKQVKYVRDGDVVQFNVSHPTITRHSFAFTIGRSSGLFELKPDTLPDAFHFESKSGIAEGEVYSTEEITITGINAKAPVSVTVNGQPATDNVQIFIDGVEATEPFMIANNGKLRLEVLHESDTSRVVVTVGSGSSEFGIYTVAEPILNTVRNWAYQAKGIEVVSDAITNPGPQRVILTLTDDTSALFDNGTKTVTLQTDQSTTIKFTPQENKQYHVVFNTEQHQYDWQVWADDHWLDSQPADQRAERYVLGDSGDIKFDAIPQNFYTHIRVPAGILLQINGEYVDLPLDVRGVYNEQTEVRDLECSTTTLRMEGLPSHDQPHTIMLGDAALKWLYDFTEDPTYSAIANVAVAQIAQQFVPVVRNSVNESNLAYVDQFSAQLTQYDQTYQDLYGSTDSHTFGRDFVAADALLDAEWLSRFVPHLDGVVSDSYQQSFVPVTDLLPVGYDTNAFVDAWTQNVAYLSTEFDTGLPEIGVAEPINEFMTAIDYLDATMDLPTVRLVPWSSVSRADLAQVNYRKTSLAAQIDNGVRAHWIQGSAGIGQSNDRLNYITQAFNWLDAAQAAVVLPRGRIDIDAATAIKRDSIPAATIDSQGAIWHSAPPIYSQKNGTPRWTHIPRVTFRYSMNVGVMFKPKSYPVPMEGRTVGSVLTYKSDIDVRFAYNRVHEIGASEVAYSPKPKSVYSHDMTVGQRQRVEIRTQPASEPRFVNLAAVKSQTPAAANQVQAPKSNEIDSAQNNRVRNNVIAVTRPQSKRAVVKTIHIPRPVTEVPQSVIDYGEQDPLKQGYFATELDALQNATQVWGHDASAVYGIKQPNGYWTWAIVVTCENVCGSYGCDTRGYLSGG